MRSWDYNAEGTNIIWKMYTCVQSGSYMCDERYLRDTWKGWHRSKRAVGDDVKS